MTTTTEGDGQATPGPDGEVLHILFAREWARIEVQKIAALNMSPFYPCSELMTHALTLVLPVSIEEARAEVGRFFDGQLAKIKQRQVDAAAQAAILASVANMPKAAATVVQLVPAAHAHPEKDPAA